jgi:hypothetical protein
MYVSHNSPFLSPMCIGSNVKLHTKLTLKLKLKLKRKLKLAQTQLMR